ncbi:hypothetical protein CO130_00645 [Candidatus Jorgensenbacteria bacterium CG_4_9_14_3_um_filter_38_10]|nr:MAG: hypothetical protein CO130_00645 [Candidatus Jorgensenbacteria bacterium CG_4_9_14_3_um_filter_38_10]
MFNFPSLLINIGALSSLLDILIVSILFYFILILFKESSSRFIFGGILISVLIYILALVFNLHLTSLIFSNFFSIFLIALIVIFRDEIRRFFKFIFVGWINYGRKLPASEKISSEIVEAIDYLKKKKFGALIVFRGYEPISDFCHGGFLLNGEISGQVLESIFDPHTPGHDGAVIIEGNKIYKFAVQLPLSENFEMTKKFGTRHAAALGLAEHTDAFIIVVSEEKGTISVAQNRILKIVSDINELTQIIAHFYSQRSKARLTFWQSFRKENLKEKIFALILSLILWIIFVLK